MPFRWGVRVVAGPGCHPVPTRRTLPLQALSAKRESAFELGKRPSCGSRNTAGQPARRWPLLRFSGCCPYGPLGRMAGGAPLGCCASDPGPTLPAPALHHLLPHTCATDLAAPDPRRRHHGSGVRRCGRRLQAPGGGGPEEPPRGSARGAKRQTAPHGRADPARTAGPLHTGPRATPARAGRLPPACTWRGSPTGRAHCRIAPKARCTTQAPAHRRLVRPHVRRRPSPPPTAPPTAAAHRATGGRERRRRRPCPPTGSLVSTAWPGGS
jgi:hypothetical protein